MKQWYPHTVYKNEEDRQAARILSILIGVSWVAYLFVIFIGLYYNDWKLIAMMVVGSVLQIVPFGLLRRRHWNASSFILMLNVLGTLTVIATLGQGIHDLAITAFPIVFIFASLTLNRAIFGLSVGLSLVALGWLIFGEANGWFVTQPYYATPTWVDFLIVAVIVLTLALAVDLLATNMRKSLDQAQREIAERKRTEETLAYHALVLENVSDAVVSGDLQFRILSFNRAAEKLYGWTAEEVLGHEFREPLKPDYGERSREQVLEEFHTQGKWAGEATHQCKDGRRIQVEVRISLVYDEAGNPVRVVSMIRDITARKRAEEALRENEVIFNSFLENSPIYIFFKDKNIRYLRLSKNYDQILGMPIHQALGKTMDELFPSDLARSMVADDLGILSEGKRVDVEEELNGRIYETTKFPILVDGKPQMLAGFTMDITERKNIEQQLQVERDFALQVMNTMGQGLTITDAKRHFEFVNPAYSRMMGYTPEELIGKRADEVTLPEDLATLEQARAERGEGKTTTYETHLVRKDGSIIPVLITGVPRPFTEGKYAGAIAVITDLTGQKRTEDQLRYISTHDILTGIYNRAFFEEELARLERSREFPVSVIVADVDNMKITNDTQGHAAGDELLRRTTAILQSAFRAADVFARIGGDEFAVLLPNNDSVTAEQLLSRVRARLVVHNAQHPDSLVQLSLGVATAERSKLVEAFTVADRRMYEDKHARKSKQ